MRKLKGEAAFWRNVRLLTRIGWTMALPIALSVLAAYWLHLDALTTVALLVAGVVLAFVALFHTVRGSGDERGD